MNRQPRHHCALESLEDRRLFAAQMIADVNVFTDAGAPQDVVTMGGAMYFSADDGVHGRELWRSDGSEAGTQRVGAAAVSPTQLAAGTSRIFFTTTTGLWVSNGTAAGTVQASNVHAEQLTVVGNNAYFYAIDGNGMELWVSDGTAAGTKMLKDINPGSGGSLPSPVVAMNGIGYFVAENSTSGRELWRTDGTAAGTFMLSDIIAGNGSSSPDWLTTVGGQLFFAASTSVSNRELWVTNGTAAGTRMVKDINPYVDNNSQNRGSDIFAPAAVGNKLYFFAETQTGPLNSSITRGLWVSDGTAAGTQFVHTLGMNYNSSGGTIFDLNGIAVTRIGLGFENNTLWRSDGTAAGTVALRTGAIDGVGAGAVTGGKLYLGTYPSSSDNNLYYTDGTVAGTGAIADVYSNSSRREMVAFGGMVYIDGTVGNSNTELVRVNPANNALSVVKDINTNTPNGSNPQYFASGGGLVYFLNGSSSYTVWRTDGTAAGTFALGNFGNSLASPSLQEWATTEQGNRFIFEINGTIYSTDGTVAGTHQLAAFGADYVSDFTRAGDKVFFVGREGPGGRLGLWVIDNDVASYVSPVGEPGFTSYQLALQGVGNTVYFVGTDYELWKSDGTATGTSRVADIFPGIEEGARPMGFADVNGTLFFFARNNFDAKYRLFKSNGTAAGTTLVSEAMSPILPTSGVGLARGSVAVVNGVYYFVAGPVDDPNNAELWRSDGTAAGTYMLKDLNGTTAVGSSPTQLTAAGSKLYFVAGAELWVSDGTAAGTVKVSGGLTGDTNPDNNNPSGPVNLTAVGNRVFFVASSVTANTGIELYVADGTPNGTKLVTDLKSPGHGLYNSISWVRRPSTLAALNGAIYFAGDDGVHGVEPWIITASKPIASIDAVSTITEGNVLALAGSGLSENGPIVKYEWDFNYDGTFNVDATGQTVNWTSADGTASKTLVLRVTDSIGVVSDIATKTVTVVNKNPTAVLGNSGPVNVGATVSVSFTGQSDVAADMAGLRYSFDFNNDGDFVDLGDVINSPTATGTFTFTTSGAKTIRGRIADKDGGFTDYTTTVQVNGTTPTTPPAAPSGIAGTVVSGNRIDVRWTDNANNETGFEIQRSAVYNFLDPTNVTVNTPNLTSYSDTTLSPNTYYYFRVRSLNAAGPSAWSGSVKLKTSKTGTTPTVPAMPTGPGATANSSSQITVNWTDTSNNETGFRIQRSSNSTFSDGLTEFTVGAGVTSFVNTGLAANTTYYYRVQSYNGTGPSAYTAGVNATTQALPAPTPPAAPTSPKATANSSSQITLTWTDNSNNETGFRILRTDTLEIDPFASGPAVFTVGAGVTSFVDTGLAANITYSYQVYAYNGVGNSTLTPVVSATTQPAPTPPTIPTAPNATANSSSQITVTWTDASNNETGFRIQRSTTSNFTAGLAEFTVGAGVTSFVNTGLTANTTYYYRVQSYNSVGPSSYTAGVNATTQPAPVGGTGPLTAPNGLSATMSRLSAMLAWNDNSNNETGWEIQISTVYNFTAGTTRSVSVPTINAESFNVTGLTANTWYYFRVRAINTTNQSAWTGSIKLKTLK